MEYYFLRVFYRKNEGGFSFEQKCQTPEVFADDWRRLFMILHIFYFGNLQELLYSVNGFSFIFEESSREAVGYCDYIG
jgi:hypothetical protein